MELHIYKDTDELIRDLAEAIRKIAEEAIAARGQFNFVLSGGSSPKNLYELLSSKAYRDKIDWKNTYFFFGDERFVPENDAQRNSLMARETLLDPLQIPKTQVFKVDTSVTPEESAQNYTKAISSHFKGNPMLFDFILLGLGDDAHTASLFPHTSVLEEEEATVKSVFIKKMDTYRITMTAPLINQAHHIAFLVFGKNKADAVYEVLKGKSESPAEYPARLINCNDKKVSWYLDTTAASRL